MDANRFDAFVLSFGRAVPRRAALVGALGTGLVGLLSRLGVETAVAKKKKKCKGGKKKCGKKCIPKTHCCKTADCPTGASCVDGRCVCPNGESVCDGSCVDLATDDANCGACGTACGSGQICITGLCLTTCENPSPSNPLTSCPADPGGICVTVDGVAVCVLPDSGGCLEFSRETCDGDPCPAGRVCANLFCGTNDFDCMLPA